MTDAELEDCIERRVSERVATVTDEILGYLLVRIDRAAEALGRAGLADPADAVTLAALADYLEEKNLPEVAARARKIPAGTGDVFILQPQHPLSPAARKNLQEGFQQWTDKVEEQSGIQVCGLVLEHDIKITHLRLKG